MAVPTTTPLPASLERTLREEWHTGQWTLVSRQFLTDILKKLQELEKRLEVLEP